MNFERDPSLHFTPLVDEKGRRFGEMADGYVNFGDVSMIFLEKPTKAGARFIDGIGQPKLGKGLRFNGDRSNYNSIGVHPEDVDEFVRRYYAYHAFTDKYIISDEENEHELNEADLDVLHRYLQRVGAFPDEETDK